MAHKLFSPLKVGALELQHRLVREQARNEARPAPVADVDPWPDGGLIVYDPKLAPGSLARLLRRPTAAGCRLVAEAHAAGQKIVLRLGGGGEARSRSADFVQRLAPERLVTACRHAAAAALSLGFDGVELDGAEGTVLELLLNPDTNTRIDRYGGHLAHRLNLLDELIEAVVRIYGCDRVGVRLAPFTLSCAPADALVTFIAALQILRDREVAYVHLTHAPTPHTNGSTRSAMPLDADLLRVAYPGILLASGAHTLKSAIELTRNRWADAVCLCPGLP